MCKPGRSVLAALLTLSCLLLTAPAAHAMELVWLGPDGNPLPFADHDEVVAFLRAAEVIEQREVGGSQNKPIKMLLEHDGVRAHAIFRRVNRIWQREWVHGTFRRHLIDRARSERAAYVVSRVLGFDNVPPTVLREIDGQRGSLQLWIEGAESLADLTDRRGEMPPNFVEQMEAIWAFDNLVFNVDRHPGNILVGPDGRLWMIDHTQSFQYDSKLLDADSLFALPATMWGRLATIDEPELEEILDDALNGTQISALLKRRQRMLELIRDRIAEFGRRQVLLDLSGLGLTSGQP